MIGHKKYLRCVRAALVLAAALSLQLVCTPAVFAGGHGGGHGGDSGGHGGGHGGHAEPSTDDIAAELGLKIRGIELGEFRVRSDHPVEAEKSTVRFILHASATSENFAEVQNVVDARRHKIRDEVIIATRMTPLSVFNEAGLAKFRRRIFMRLRRSVPELPIEDVYVSDFQLAVKSQ